MINLLFSVLKYTHDFRYFLFVEKDNILSKFKKPALFVT